MKLKTFMKAALTVVALTPFFTFAGEYGTAEEAKAMLEKAVAEIKKDKAGALAKFNKGEGGFKDRDLYPFCAGPDGSVTAHPAYYPKLDRTMRMAQGQVRPLLANQPDHLERDAE
jgi:hypothetical protein